MKKIAIIVIITAFVFSLTDLHAQRKFKVEPIRRMNGGMSPNGEWYIMIDSEYLGTEPNAVFYSKIEVINLSKYNLNPLRNGKTYVDYEEKKIREAKPELVLYDQNSNVGPLSRIIWNVDSTSVTIYPRGNQGGRIFTYNTKTKFFSTSKINEDEFLKRKAKFIKLPNFSGIFYEPDKNVKNEEKFSKSQKFHAEKTEPKDKKIKP